MRRYARRRSDESVTVFVVSAGEEVLADCIEALDRQTCRFRLERIADVYPMSAAFQAMPDRCRTPYFVQVDADMVLEPDAIETLHGEIVGTGPRTVQVSGQLYEEGFGPGGAVKCWRRSLFRAFRFRDVRTVDRDLYRRIGRFGLAPRHLDRQLGIHRPRHSAESAWLKAKGDVEKWRYLGREPEAFALPLVRGLLEDHMREPDRLAGALLGALTREPRLSRSKDIRHERAVRGEVLALLDLPGAGDPPLASERREELADRFAAAYKGGAGAPLAETIAALCNGGPQAPDKLLELAAR